MLDIQKIIEFAESGVVKFVDENPTLKFYSFAFECNAEYGEINLCLNTEEAFSETLSYYQKGESAQYYKENKDIQSLKYNTGDWKYQCFDTIYIFSDEELSTIFNNIYPDGVNDDYLAWEQFISKLLESFTESIIRFSKTAIFKKLNKTDDFNFFCIDHEEDLPDAFKRMEGLQKRFSD